MKAPVTGLARIAVMVIENPSLLITDDDSAFRHTLQEVLESLGFHTILAEDGEQAVRIVSTKVVHLVLLDMHMPKLTGLETLRQVKQVKALLPCILMSANLDEMIVEQAQHATLFGAAQTGDAPTDYRNRPSGDGVGVQLAARGGWSEPRLRF